MNSVLVLLRKDFALFLKDRASIVLTFLVPMALIYVFGLVFHVNDSDPGPSGIPVAVVNLSDNPAAARLVDALKRDKTLKVLTRVVNDDKTTRPMTEEDLRPMMHADNFRFALVIPRDVIRADAIGIHLRTYSNPRNEVESQMVNGLLQRAIFTNVPELLGQSLQARARAFIGDTRMNRFNATIASAISNAFGGDPAQIQSRIDSGDFGLPSAVSGESGNPSQAADILSRIVKVEDVQVEGKGIKSPQATQLVGGWAMQFLLFALTASATALFREKDLGIFHRLLSAPVTKAQILWSKFLYGIILGLVQLVVLFAAGHVLYGIEIGGQLPSLVVVCVFAAAACTSFGMLIASVSPTPEAARGIATFVILLMCAVGGAWFPVSFMPEFMQHLSKLTLVYWSIEGFSQVLWARATLPELVPILGWLALTTALVMTLAVWRFNKGKIFD
jgi:ABC-2 type transport system permease protein